MKITEIVKDAFVFPSKDFGKLSAYIVLSIMSAFLAVGGLIYLIIGISGNQTVKTVIGAVVVIVALILEFIIMGYQISIIKSGIDREQVAPDYDWTENLLTGIKQLIVEIVYNIIPAIVVLAAGLISNVPGNAMAVFNEVSPSLQNMTNATSPMSYSAAGANVTMPVIHIPDALAANLATSLAITAVVAIVVFIIFALIQTMAEARLANTGSLAKALNMIEAFRDIGRIGWGKFIAAVIVIVILVALVNILVGFVVGYVPIIFIINLIIAPYMMFFALRAVGLLYSDIA